MKTKTIISTFLLSSLLAATAPAATYLFDFGTNSSAIQAGWTRVTTNSADPNAGTALAGSTNISMTIPVGQTIHYRDRGQTASFGTNLDNLNLLRDIIYVDGLGAADTVTFTISGLTGNASYTVLGYAVDMFNATTNDNKTVSWTTNGGSVNHTTDSGNPDLAFARFQMATMTADNLGFATITAQTSGGIILLNGLEITQIPEPSAALLGGLGLLALLRRRR